MYQHYYQKRWSADQPGCLIILLDQSESMEDPIASGVTGEISRKADEAAEVVNSVLYEMIRRCTKGSVISPRVDVAVLGYGSGGTVYNALRRALSGTDGNPLADRSIVSIAELAVRPLEIKRTVVKEFDAETGKMFQVSLDTPVWVEPIGEGNTPMCAALDTAHYIAYHWINDKNHVNSFPPVIVNVTDGASTDGEPEPHAAQIRQLMTNDGAALLFNCHISQADGFQVKYPSDISQVPYDSDGLAHQLFNMSSILPDPMVSFANASYNMNLYRNARGFVFGGDITDLTQFITIASLPKRSDR
jgi:hypothetical protein